MCGNIGSVSSENLSKSNQPTVRISSSKGIGKKLYAIAGIIVILVIVITLLIPQGAATIPLSVKYTVGEKMTYDMIETITTEQIQGIMGINSTVNVEVVDFDGEHYTLNYTVTAVLNHQHPMSISYIARVNKTGYTTYFHTGKTQQLLYNMSSNPVLSAVLNKPEVKVGDAWQIPLSTGETNVSVKGDLTVTFVGIQDMTVPAGTYRVFRIDFSSNNIRINITIPTPYNTSIQNTVEMSLSGQTYLEYGTCRQIKYSIQINSSSKMRDSEIRCSISSQMILVKHIAP